MNRPPHYHLYGEPDSEYPVPQRAIRRSEQAAQRRADQNVSKDKCFC